MRPRITTGPDIAVIAAQVRELKDEFDYPDLFGRGGSASLPAAGGGGTPTVVVAPSNASDLSKSKADYVLPGANDTLVIQQVVELVEGVHGRILITEGTIFASWDDVQAGAGGLLGTTSGITLQGMGSGASGHAATILNIVGTPAVSDVAINFRGPGTRIQGIRIEDDRSANTFDVTAIVVESYAVVSDITGVILHGTFIDCQGSNSWIDRVIVEYAEVGLSISSGDGLVVSNCNVFAKNAAIQSFTGSNHFISNCRFQVDDSTVSYPFDFACDRSRITGCVFVVSTELAGVQAAVKLGANFMVFDSNAVVVSEAGSVRTASGLECVGTDNIVSTNDLTCDVTSSTAQFGIATSTTCLVTSNRIFGFSRGVQISGDHSIVTGNDILDCQVGVFSDGSQLEASVVANLIYNAQFHGMQFDDILRFTIADNTIIEPGAATDNTYDGILLEGNSDENYIHGNRITAPAAGNQPRYGINVSAATCNNNIYAGNWAGPTANFGTAPYNDAGTGTLNVWPGAAAPVGDNYTL